MKATFWIACTAVRELLYERVFYLLILFSLLALGLSALLGQLTYAEQSKLTLDFMLGAIELAMVLFAVFMGISLFHRELALGSVSMVLSKPIARWNFLLGKFLGQWIVQSAVIALMGLIVFISCSRFGEHVSAMAVAQTLLMTIFQVAIVTSITYLFAVVSNAVTSALATLTLFALGHLREGAGENLGPGNHVAWGTLKYVVPDLEVFNMKALASYGQAISAVELGWSALYALCCVVFFVMMAALLFQRKDIQT